MNARHRWLVLSAAVLLLDQASKAVVRARLPLHDSRPVIPDLFSLTHVTNRGALFGLLHDLPDPWRAVLFTIVPFAAIVLILYFQGRTAPADRLAHGGLALILGGAAGNFLDRIRLGHVIDFLDVYVGTHHWPAFNAADSAICIGVALLILDLLRPHRRSQPLDATAAAPAESPGSPGSANAPGPL
jgi:signal peptidase II